MLLLQKEIKHKLFFLVVKTRELFLNVGQTYPILFRQALDLHIP